MVDVPREVQLSEAMIQRLIRESRQLIKESREHLAAIRRNNKKMRFINDRIRENAHTK
jgi:hypothetical protein